MRLQKTLRARAALATHGHELSQAERRILILCDGRRAAQDIIAMLGADSATGLQLLLEQGYLEHAVNPATAAIDAGAHNEKPNATGGPFGKLLQRGRDAVGETAATRTIVAQPVTAPPPALTSKAARSRRSMAASKMYMLDMLQLQRQIEGSALAVDIQTSQNEDDLLRSLLDALIWLRTTTKPSMFARIADRLREVLPETHLPALQAVLPTAEAGAPDNVIRLDRRALAGS